MRERVWLRMERERRENVAGMEWIFMLTMVYGTMFFLNSIEGLDISWEWIWIPAAIPMGMLWMGERRWGKWGVGAVSALLLLLVLGLGIGSTELRNQLQRIWESLRGSGMESYGNVNGGVLLLLTLETLLLGWLEVVFRIHMPLYILTTGLMLASPMFGIELREETVFFFFVFQILFWGIQVLGSVPWRGSVRTDQEGIISRGNLYPADMRQLTVSSDRRPTERIYLKGFSGGDYVNGEWLAADDEAIFQRMEENALHWDRWSSLIPGMYRSMFFIMNVNMRRDEQLLSRGLWIEPENLANEPGLVL